MILTLLRNCQTKVVDSIRYCGKASSQTTPAKKTAQFTIQPQLAYAHKVQIIVGQSYVKRKCLYSKISRANKIFILYIFLFFSLFI